MYILDSFLSIFQIVYAFSFSQDEFHITEVNSSHRSIPLAFVDDHLNNGKALSLFFHGVFDSDIVLNGKYSFISNFA